MYNEQFAANVRAECKKQKIAVHKLFEMCGVRKGLLYDIEKRGTDISARTALAIADALNVSLDGLFGRRLDQSNNGGNIVNGNVENSSLTVSASAGAPADTMLNDFVNQFLQLEFSEKVRIMALVSETLNRR